MSLTSPPYNLDVDYSSYRDGQPRDEYLQWLRRVFRSIRRVLASQGSFFLNVGHSNKDPWVDMEVGLVAREFFVLQNRVVWVKSIAVDSTGFANWRDLDARATVEERQTLDRETSRTDGTNWRRARPPMPRKQLVHPLRDDSESRHGAGAPPGYLPRSFGRDVHQAVWCSEGVVGLRPLRGNGNHPRRGTRPADARGRD